MIVVRRERPVLTLLVCALASWTGVAQSSQTLPTFRTGVDIMQLDVVVLDKNRRPVTGLTATDFTVLEDGKPRPVVAFAPITLPEAPAATIGRAVWTREVAPDVVSNQRDEVGRLAVIFLDRSIPMEGPTVAARTIAHQIVDALGPGDLAAVVRSSNFSREGFQQGFTADRRRLHAAIDAPYIGQTNPPVMSGVGGGLVRPLVPDQNVGDCPGGRCVLEQLGTVALSLEREVRRQKIVFFIGSTIAITDRPLELDGQRQELRKRLLSTLARSNVTVHVLDPIGLETAQKAAEAFGGDAGASARRQALLDRQESLKVLPTYTGGRAVLNTNTPEFSVPALLDEGRSYYLLAYQQADAKGDGRRHAIKIQVNRPGVTVRSRNGYVAAAPRADTNSEPPDPSTKALSGLLPAGDLPLQMSATSSFAADGTSEASIVLGIGSTASAPEADRLDVVIATFDDHAMPVHSARHSVDVPAGPTPRSVEHRLQLALEPGHYEVRAAVMSARLGRSGSVYAYVDVPELTHDALALSGISVSAGRAATLRRTFSSEDDVDVEVQVHRSDRPVSVDVRVVDAHGREAAAQRMALPAAIFTDAGIASYRMPLPLRSLTAGDYLLTIDAADGQRTEHRDVRFTVK